MTTSQPDSSLFPVSNPVFYGTRETLRGLVQFDGVNKPEVRMKGVHPAAAWMDYLHLPLGYLARVMFTMPGDDFYGGRYFLESLQEVKSRVHLESLHMELVVGLGMKHPEWLDRKIRYGFRQRSREGGRFFLVEADMPDEFPAVQLAQSFIQIALEVHRHLPLTQGELLWVGLRKMGRAFLSGEVNPYDWKSLITFPLAVLEEQLSGAARRSAALA